MHVSENPWWPQPSYLYSGSIVITLALFGNLRSLLFCLMAPLRVTREARLNKFLRVHSLFALSDFADAAVPIHSLISFSTLPVLKLPLTSFFYGINPKSLSRALKDPPGINLALLFCCTMKSPLLPFHNSSID